MNFTTGLLAAASCFVIVAARPALAADRPSLGAAIGASASKPRLGGADSSNVIAGGSPGLIAGVNVSLPVSDRFSIQPEVFYTQKSFSFATPVGQANTFSASERWDFVEVSILGTIGIQPAATPSFYVVFGPGFSFVRRAKETHRAGTVTGVVFSLPDIDVKDQIRPDVSVIGGVGITVRHFSLEGRYDAGLRNINNGLDIGNFKVKTGAFSVLAGWRF